jgi:hypothetical protein
MEHCPHAITSKPPKSATCCMSHAHWMQSMGTSPVDVPASKGWPVASFGLHTFLNDSRAGVLL